MKEKNTYNQELGSNNLPDSLRVNPFLTPKNFFLEQESHILNQIKIDQKIIDLAAKENDNLDNYFDKLEDSIFAKITESELKEKISDTGFTVPENYFSQLEEDIDIQIKQDHLRELVPTLDYEVPSDYFSTTEQEIFSKIYQSNIDDIVGKNDGFQVPENYFETSQSEIEAIAKIDSIKKDFFSVPQAYFDKLNKNILDKTISKQESASNIVELPRTFHWKKYAAAAAVTLIVGVGAYFGIQNANNNSTDYLAANTAEPNFENLSDDEIINYLAYVSEGEDLFDLAEFISNDIDDNLQLDTEIEEDKIEDYLNYML